AGVLSADGSGESHAGAPMAQILLQAKATWLDQLQQVPELVFLGLEILARALRGVDFERHPLDDFEAVSADRHVLGRVVRHQTHTADTEVSQDLAADAVVADVGRKSELLIGGNGVVPLVLQLVGLQLVDEPDPSSLLKKVEKDSSARLAGLL